jgi:hypothetical protein
MVDNDRQAAVRFARSVLDSLDERGDLVAEVIVYPSAIARRFLCELSVPVPVMREVCEAVIARESSGAVEPAAAEVV